MYSQEHLSIPPSCYIFRDSLYVCKDELMQKIIFLDFDGVIFATLELSVNIFRQEFFPVF